MDVPAQRQKLSKLLYHCYTKLFELGRILSGQDPVVHMCGEATAWRVYWATLQGQAVAVGAVHKASSYFLDVQSNFASPYQYVLFWRKFAPQFATPQIWLSGRTEAEKFALAGANQICVGQRKSENLSGSRHFLGDVH